MVYPTLPQNATAVSIFERGLSPYYDIVWSVTYRVDDSTPTDELGICLFLQDESKPLSSGGVGIDLGYSGLSAYNALSASSVGMLSAVIGIGLDSTGQFPLSAQRSNGTTRDGLGESERILNSVSIRGSYPSYSYLPGSNTKITEFDIVDSQRKTLRARLGNYGRTIFLDYRKSENDDFVNILTKNVNITFSETTRFRPGVSITKPISSPLPTSHLVVIEAFHVEGKDEDPTTTVYEFKPLTIYSYNSAGPDVIVDPPDGPEEPPLPPLPPDVFPPVLPKSDVNCGETIQGTSDVTSIHTINVTGITGILSIEYTTAQPPLTSLSTGLSALSYRYDSTGSTNFLQLSVTMLSANQNDFALFELYEGSMVWFENLDVNLNNKPLTITVLPEIYNMCTNWITESGVDNLGNLYLSATYCSEYLSSFSVILTGNYLYYGGESNTLSGDYSNRLHKVFYRKDIPPPKRFRVKYDLDYSFYDTSFIGNSAYNYGGEYRSIFIDSIKLSPLSANMISGIDEYLIAPDNYPWVTASYTNTINLPKQTDSVRAELTVYNPLSDSDWSFTMYCPSSADRPPPYGIVPILSTIPPYSG